METKEYAVSANPQTSFVEHHPSLEELRLDVAWEARHGIADKVACRECGTFRKTPLWQLHLKKFHKLTSAEYDALYPGARLISFAYIANINADSGRGSTDVRELMANFADSYFTGEQVTEGRANAKWEKDHGIIDAVMCRICGLRVRSRFRPHLKTAHPQMTLEQYRTNWPNAPTVGSDIARAHMTEVAKRSWRRSQAEIDQLRSSALPNDWNAKTPEEVFIGLILRQRPYMSNDELGDCLDASRGPKCRWSSDGSWGIITRPGPAANFITKIRKWVGRQGRTPRVA